jgi:hypothetical protein
MSTSVASKFGLPRRLRRDAIRCTTTWGPLIGPAKQRDVRQTYADAMLIGRFSEVLLRPNLEVRLERLDVEFPKLARSASAQLVDANPPEWFQEFIEQSADDCRDDP